MTNFIKSRWPTGRSPCHWRKCYFLAGDRISFQYDADRISTDTVTRPAKNNKGRISYWTKKGLFIFLEDIVKAEGKKRKCVR